MVDTFPYASPGVVSEFFTLLDKHIPAEFTTKTLQQKGFSLNNSRALLSALRNMELIDENGEPLDRDVFVRLGLDSERQAELKKIVDRTYDGLVEGISISEATIDDVVRYFRLEGVKSSMAVKAARLFLWLAAEAGYQVGEEIKPSKIVTRISKQSNSRDTDKNGDSTESDIQDESNDFDAAIDEAYDHLDPLEKRLLHGLLDKLDTNPDWPSDKALEILRELMAKKKKQ